MSLALARTARRAAAVALTASLIDGAALLAGGPANAATSPSTTTAKPKVLSLTMLKTARTVIAGDHMTIRATMKTLNRPGSGGRFV
jgi:hypothetical protein